ALTNFFRLSSIKGVQKVEKNNEDNRTTLNSTTLNTTTSENIVLNVLRKEFILITLYVLRSMLYVAL
ncbi:hypothetical protein C0995_016588, partial [Termitomyces sp. Mi166